MEAFRETLSGFLRECSRFPELGFRRREPVGFKLYGLAFRILPDQYEIAVVGDKHLATWIYDRKQIREPGGIKSELTARPDDYFCFEAHPPLPRMSILRQAATHRFEPGREHDARQRTVGIFSPQARRSNLFVRFECYLA